MPNTAVQPEIAPEEQTQEEEIQTKPSLQRAMSGNLQAGENIFERSQFTPKIKLSSDIVEFPRVTQ
ncbi:MAG: hypothetical protein V7K38_06380 [Nostoc sp.]|uniref:hypothetical protein n=1 Tax=Nostoc sp. TaxID=1180 RepID=UPI002FFA9E79